jgi:hypothetical protein
MKKLGVVLLILGALLLVADRVGVRVAQGAVAQQIASHGGLQGTPQVEITGFPFLTQAVRGRYDEVRVHLTADELGQPEGTHADVSLRGVRLPLADLLAQRVVNVPVDRVDGTATVPYAVLAAQLGGNTTLAPEDGGLRITGTVAVLGAQLPVTATASLALDGQDLVVDVDRVSAAGVKVPAVLLGRAANLLHFRYPLPALPLGLQVTGVEPGQDGVLVRVKGQGTVLQN